MADTRWRIVRIARVPLLGLIMLRFAQAGTFADVGDLIEEAKAKNPEIQAARATYEAARQRVSSFYHLAEPWMGIEFSKDMRIYSVTQEFPFPTRLISRSKRAEYETSKYYHEYEAKVLEVTRKTKTAYARLFVIEREIETMRQVKNILDRMSNIARRNYTLNLVTQTDVLRVQVELLKLENNLVNSQNEKSLVATELNLLLNRMPDELLEINSEVGLDTPIPPLDTLYEWARDNHPILKSFKNRIQAAQVSLAIARQEYLPDLMVKFETEELDMQLQNPKFMIGFTLPLWFYGKQRNMVQEMKAELQGAEAEYKTMENMVLNMVKAAAVMSQNYKREIDLYRNAIIPQVEAAFKNAIGSYEANKIDFGMLLDAQRMYVETELEYFHAQANFAISLADLEESTSRDLKER